jgi:hypothetical protein
VAVRFTSGCLPSPDVDYLGFLRDLAIDLVAILLLTCVVYYRRHRRRDLVLAYFALNVGLFVVVSTLSVTTVDVALGFGLFAILSIIRLRSDTITQEEVAYYFVALVLGLVNGLPLPGVWPGVVLSLVLVVGMYVVDHRRLFARAQRHVVTLDVVHADPAELRADLERRLRGRVVHMVVTEVDYVRDVTVVDVRFTAAPPAARRPATNGARRDGSSPRPLQVWP